MKIAISICSDRVSNVFDFSTNLLLIEIVNGKEISRSEVPLVSRALPQRVEVLKSLEVETLVCGAVSRALANMVTTSGIELLAFVTGKVDEVLQAYLTGRLEDPEFTMPGCWSGARKGFGQCRQGRRECRRQGRHENFEL